MKTNLHFISIIFIVLGFNLNAQINFESGYIIDINNNKYNCLIKNYDWKNSPKEIEYKITENADVQIANPSLIKEFGITNQVKYITANVNIDRSSDIVEKLSKERNPVFNSETLFLKVLVEGNADLYVYDDIYFKRFFYKKTDKEITQLIYKRYKTYDPEKNKNIIDPNFRDYDQLAENNQFRQQLSNDVNCLNYTLSKFETINYNNSDLIKHFIAHNKCSNPNNVTIESKNKGSISISLRPRIRNSNLKVYTDDLVYLNNNENNATVGLEFEYFFPYNKKSWSLFVEPIYQKFSSSEEIYFRNISGNAIVTEANFQTLEIPIGLRHYIYLNQSNKIFLNAAMSVNFGIDGKIRMLRKDNSEFSYFNVDGASNLVFGMGYQLLNKFTVEARYGLKGDILKNNISTKADYSFYSFIFGYKINL